MSGFEVPGHLVLALIAVVALSRALAWLLAAVHQPPVMGDVLAGIALGPSLLGAISPHASAFLLPGEIRPALAGIAVVGVSLYMFLVGLGFEGSFVRDRWRSVAAISQAGIGAPFLLGGALAFWFGADPAGRPPSIAFVLFLGVAMSVTAFPVLARIVTDWGLSETDVGRTALASAAFGDVTAWCLLAVAIGAAHAGSRDALGVLAGAAVFAFALLVLVRPVLVRWCERLDRRASLPASGYLAAGLLVAGSAFFTDRVGIHAVFGAFMAGVIVPSRSLLAKSVRERVLRPVSFALLPAFFALAGMQTDLGRLSEAGAWMICLTIVAAAFVGKVGATSVAARFAGFAWRPAWALGFLMNARGVMELVVLQIGLDLGILPPPLYAMLVVMTLVTTLSAGPAMRLLGAGRQPSRTSVGSG